MAVLPMKALKFGRLALVSIAACACQHVGAASYSYDAAGRLLSVSYPGLGVVSYAYDTTGNLTSIQQIPLAAPSVTTSSATGLSATGATLNGFVSANGADTSVTFDYGPSVNYGTRTAASPATLGASQMSTVSLSIGQLSCGTTYHFRANATNSVGAASGDDQNFTTSICPPGAPTLLSVTFGKGSATVSFAPAASGGGATSFTATCTAAGHPAKSATGASSPITVRGLTGGVAYSCSVVANNSTGSSISSAVMLVTPLKVGSITPILMLLLD